MKFSAVHWSSEYKYSSYVVSISGPLEIIMSRPVVSVFDPEVSDKVDSTVSLPAVFTAPIRHDVVHYVHTLMAKNKRQAYAVSLLAGHQVCHL